ncbi:MAG: RHS repeat-associated core domain-containing protein [Prevotellaceae bacterium]|jgi:RHS repeat-associated protein|nr:RHS repeat-associated core domain-containing protein [Prevotellaceae bacterium]
MKNLALITLILAFAANAFAAGAGIAGGRIQKTSTGYEINYYITDHLGSTRVVVSQSGTVLGTNDYYPFGKRWEGANLQAPNTRYLFSGKERQTTADINYMDFGSRMYDDFLGRWFTQDPLAEEYYPLSPYAYCGNNPVTMIDPDGEGFFSSLWGAVSGFWKGIFNLKGRGENILEKVWNGIKDVAKSTWDGFRNSIKINWGLFQGNPHQIVSRFTWELPQTFIGNEWSHIRNITWQVDKVRYFDGATYVINANSKYRMGVTLGSYINIDIRESYDKNIYEPNGKFTVINDPLFMHEYGHYIQSQEMGWGYLFEVGLPSFFSAMNSKKNYAYRKYSWGGKAYLTSHDVYRKEMAANREAAYYFYIHYGVDWSGDYFIEYPLNLDDVIF